jgi:altered-inheritance-of-mitochondria protein 5
LRARQRREGVYRGEDGEGEMGMQRRPSMTDLLKQRWNGEVRGMVRRAQEVRWEDVWVRAGEGWSAAVRLVKRE